MRTICVIVVLALGSSGVVFAQSTADLDHNGFVDADDQLLFQAQWHTMGANRPETPPSAEVSTSIIDATIPNDNRPEVEFSLLDGEGKPIDPATLNTFRFIIAKIVEGDISTNPLATHYENYLTTTVFNAVGNATPGTVMAEQSTFDSGGANVTNITMLANGNLLYKFADTIDIQPADMGLTHTIGAQIDYRVDGHRSVANPLFNFVPNGSPVTTVRELIRTERCNGCHTTLALHGGGRREVGLCILCHNPKERMIDPDSGNILDFANMIHHIHRGANLPTVAAGTSEYIIYGFNNNPHNYSDVEFPQDIRNCDVCHVGSVAHPEQADYNLRVPSRRACGACHDDVNFQTGEEHELSGLPNPQADDTACAGCHPSSGPEFPTEIPFNIPGVHTVPYKSTQLAGLNAEILEVRNAAPGSAPLVRFRLFENDDDPIDISTLNRVAINVAGPTVDYATEWIETANAANTTDEGSGVYSYQMTTVIDASATGTYAFGLETRGNTFEIVPGNSLSSVRESAFNPVVYADLGTKGTAVPRRQVVDVNVKCNICHDQLTLHGGLRRNTQYCVMCHHPSRTDIARIPTDASTGLPIADPVSIHFKYMIHKIHTGEDLDNPYTIYGFGGNPFDATEIRFPGLRQECLICHVSEESYDLPLPAGVLDTVVEDASGTEISRLRPTQAACIACHDRDLVATHTDVQISFAGGSESCIECHGTSEKWDVHTVHQQ